MTSVSQEALLAMREEAAKSIERLSDQLSDARRELSAIEDLLRIRYSWIPDRPKASSEVGIQLADFEAWAKEEWLPMFRKGTKVTTSQFSQWIRQHHPGSEDDRRIRNLIGLTFKKLVGEGLIELVRKGEGRAPSIYVKY